MSTIIKGMWDSTLTSFWIYTVAILSFYFLYKLKNHLKIVKLILKLKGPPIIPFIGNAGYLYHDDFLYQMSHMAYKMYGSVFRIWVTIVPAVVVLEPQDIQQVLSNPRHTEKAFFYKLLHNFLGKGLITSDIETWRVHRRLLQPLFHRHALEKFVRTFNRISSKLVERLSNLGGSGLDITSSINDSVYEILSETVLGQDNEKTNMMNSPFRNGQVLFSFRLTRPWLLVDWIYKQTAVGKNERKHRENLVNTCKTVMDENSEGKTSLLEFLKGTSAKYPNFSKEDIMNECCTFMLAGQDSVGSATALSFFMLAKHLDWQKKCVQELKDIFGDDDREPNLQDLTEMRTIEMCIKETLRLYPSVPLIGRVLGEDIQIGNHSIPKGCTVIIMPYSTHRLSHHFPDPHNFNPEHFNSENSAKRHPYAYLPFSAGPRNCIGYKFALLEIKTMISAVLRKCSLDLVPGKEEAVPKFRITVRVKGGLWIKVKLKESSFTDESIIPDIDC